MEAASSCHTPLPATHSLTFHRAVTPVGSHLPVPCSEAGSNPNLAAGVSEPRQGSCAPGVTSSSVLCPSRAVPRADRCLCAN